MERFKGIFVATTKRLDDLDQASLRRFAWKVRFDPLTEAGRVHFYHRMLAPLVGRPLGQNGIRVLVAMPGLTPGILLWYGIAWALTHRTVLEALLVELEAKPEAVGERRVGF